VHAAGGADIDERYDRRMFALLERAYLAPRDADVPHAAARQHLDGIPVVVRFRLRFVHRAHTTAAQRIHERERPQDEPLRLALKQTFGLKVGQNVLADEILCQSRRLRSRILIEKLSDDLIELPAINQIAAAQIPDEPFAGSKIRCQHGGGVLCCEREIGAEEPLHADHLADNMGYKNAAVKRWLARRSFAASGL
jgi:hypothetical protein